MKIHDAILLSIDNVLKEGLTDVDVFSKPFEIDMLKNDKVKNKVIEVIKTSLKENNIKLMGITPISYILVPKKELFDFRKCALIQPLDELKYLSLVLQISDKIEVMRISKSKNHIFSYRLKPQKGYLFDPDYNFTSFREHVSKKSKQKNINVVVSCDIGNFYDRLNLHRLECILSSNDKIDKKIIQQINELLLFWSNRDSYGLPVGSNASRILAEASLIEVDNYLISKKIDFCRFVDDYRIFAKDAATAHYSLSILVDKLNKEGLFLNTSKTEIKDVSKDKGNREENLVQKIEINEEILNTLNIDEGLLRNKFNIPKIIRGYSGLIPTKFRKLTEKETKKLLENKIEELYNEIEISTLMEPKAFVELIKTAIAQEKSVYLVKIITILKNFPQFLPYTLDVIIKYEYLLTEEQIEEIENELQKWLETSMYSEYILVFLVRFFSVGKCKNKKILFDYFRQLKRNAGNYIGRAVLEELEKLISRGEVLEIRDYYVRADLWEKRQIAKIVDIHISDGEKRPFFKNILAQDNDIFLSFINGFFSKKNKKEEI
jgi:hypothetical protein